MRKKALKVAALFAEKGILWGTVSQSIRSGIHILRYFLYFVCLKDLNYSSPRHNIFRVNSHISINNIFVDWSWTDKDNNKVGPITARMTFVVNTTSGKILELHSSVLPAPNTTLKEISGKY